MWYSKVGMATVLSALCACADGRSASGTGEASAKRLRTPEQSIEPRRFRRVGDQILTDTFVVRSDLRGDNLTLGLDSDLADATKLVVSVSRDYQERGSTDRYSVDYFSEHSTVGAWRRPRTVTLDHDAWKREIEQRQRALAAVGEPFTIFRIADSIEVSFVVPVNQDPPFKRWNENLAGRVVTQSGSLRIVKHETALLFPMDTMGVGQVRLGAPFGLEVHTTYFAARHIPIVPEIAPTDPIAAIAGIRQLDPGEEFTVIEVRTRENTVWYRVRTRIGDGWVSSIALLGQDLRVVR